MGPHFKRRYSFENAAVLPPGTRLTRVFEMIQDFFYWNLPRGEKSLEGISPLSWKILFLT